MRDDAGHDTNGWKETRTRCALRSVEQVPMTTTVRSRLYFDTCPRGRSFLVSNRLKCLSCDRGSRCAEREGAQVAWVDATRGHCG